MAQIKATIFLKKINQVTLLIIFFIIIFFSFIIYHGLHVQSLMLNASGISYQQRIALEKVGSQLSFLIEEAGKGDEMPLRMAIEIRTNISKAMDDVNANNDKLKNLFHENSGFSLLWLSDMGMEIEKKITVIDSMLSVVNKRVTSLQNSQAETLHYGFDLWDPADSLIAPDGELLHQMLQLNQMVYQSALHKNKQLYLFYGVLIFLMIYAMWMIRAWILLPLLNKIVEHHEQLDAKNKDMSYLLEHDNLTGLSNRYAFNCKMSQLFESDEFVETSVLIVMDIDNFKSINDNYGHHTGDKVLVFLSRTLQENLLTNEYLYRLGGDEFALILCNINSIFHAKTRVKRLHESIRESQLNSRTLRFTCSMGATLGNKSGSSIDEFFSAADAALYHVKENGRNHFKFFSDFSSTSISDHLKLESEIFSAVKNEEFTVVYQPIVDVEKKKIVSLEALARWVHPVRGLLEPAEWIATAERPSQLSVITEQIISQVKQDRDYWEKEYNGSLCIYINITESLLINGVVFEKISDIDFCNSSVTIGIEIAESVIFDRSFDTVKMQLEKLKQLGVKIALDDFGTGFANLAHLQHIPFDSIKVDQSFVSKIQEDKRMKLVVKILIDLADGVEKQLVCEGVENQETLDELYQLGCKFVQGHFYSKPLPFHSITSLLNQFGDNYEHTSYVEKKLIAG